MTPSPTAAPALQTRDLGVGYRAGRARCSVLERVNVTARGGELVCLLGANGSGKSTLLRTLVRLQPALEGHIELGGAALTAITHIELARRVGVVLTERVLVNALPAARVVELGRYAHSGWWGRLTEDDRRAVRWAMESAGAGHLAGRDFSRLSDGERQRVMIARALAQEPSLLVLDEPTAFLDVTARAEVWALLRHLAKERHLAIVVSSHDVEVALGMADVIWVITPDRAITAGTPEEVIVAVERTFRLAGSGSYERTGQHEKH